jgi:hypothetical protein
VEFDDLSGIENGVQQGTPIKVASLTESRSLVQTLALPDVGVRRKWPMFQATCTLAASARSGRRAAPHAAVAKEQAIYRK